MRTVAVAALLMLSALAIPPASSANECQTSTTASAAYFCTPFEVTRPAPPPPAPGMPSQTNPYFGVYYLFVAGTKCTSPFSINCSGTPAQPGGGLPMPTGGFDPAPAVFGVLWQETNSCAGLQRTTPTFGCGQFVLDRLVLV